MYRELANIRTYMMMVTAATPSSPTYRSMVQLNIMVTMPVTRAVAISEHPLEAAFTRTRSRNTGFLKCSRFFLSAKTNRPTTAVTEYPMPVAMAAPPMPMSNPAINT